MPEFLKLPGQREANRPETDDPKDKENIRLLSRSPHPYHKRNFELLEPSGQLPQPTGANATAPLRPPPLDTDEQLSPLPTFTKESTPGSESGTEADDEAYVKRLPAPRAKLHKGLRGRSDFSESTTPLPTPTDAEFDQKGLALKLRARKKDDEEKQRKAKVKRNRELKRRTTEVLILGALTWLVVRNPDVEPVVTTWKNGEFFARLLSHCVCLGSVCLLTRAGQSYEPKAPCSWPWCPSIPCGFLRGLMPEASL